MSSILAGLGSAASSAGNAIGSGLASAGSSALSGLESAGSAVADGLSSAAGSVANTAGSAGNWIGKQAGSLGEWLSSPDAYKGAFWSDEPTQTANQPTNFSDWLKLKQQQDKREQENRRMAAAYNLMQSGLNMANTRRWF